MRFFYKKDAYSHIRNRTVVSRDMDHSTNHYGILACVSTEVILIIVFKFFQLMRKCVIFPESAKKKSAYSHIQNRTDATRYYGRVTDRYTTFPNIPTEGVSIYIAHKRAQVKDAWGEYSRVAAPVGRRLSREHRRIGVTWGP